MGRDPYEFHDWVRPLGEKYVCADCVGDYGLRRFIAAHAVHKRCSYCGKENRRPIAAPINDVTVFIYESVMTEHELAVNSLYYESAEGGYQGPTTDFYDLIRDGGLLESDNEELITDVLEALPHLEPLVPKRFFYDETGELRYTWKKFCEHVTHRQRYVFSEARTGHARKANFRREGEPYEILTKLGAMTRALHMTRTLKASTIIYRGREHSLTKLYKSAKELGIPPADRASQSRMSAAGIPVFYGALDEETTRAEVESANPGKPVITIGKFEILRPLRVLDLANPVDVPSIFDVSRRNERSGRAFLRAFTADISRPIERDDRIHVEYVPTQIVAEYFRHVFRDAHGRRLDGILYPTAKKRDGACCVLFLDRDDCVDDVISGKALCLVATSRSVKRRRKS